MNDTLNALNELLLRRFEITRFKQLLKKNGLKNYLVPLFQHYITKIHQSHQPENPPTPCLTELEGTARAEEHIGGEKTQLHS